MIRSERFSRSAYFVNNCNEVEQLKRTPFMCDNYTEVWLQQLIELNPSILPSSSIGDDFAQLICIGREVSVGSGTSTGYIDNLYISSSGHIVIVETKLFRNHESRRAVISQIIDYAKEVSKWDINKLDQVAGDYYYKREGQAYRIIDLFARHNFASYEDEARLTDTINANLANTSFLLMVVGDGIRSNVEQIADFLDENAFLPFELGLVELEIYQQNDAAIIIPNLLVKTSIIDRKVFSISDGKLAPASFDQTMPQSSKPLLSRQEFISRLADLGGYDPDRITEFVNEVEAINGITVNITQTELQFRITINREQYSFLCFSIWNDHSDLYIMPNRLSQFLHNHGIFPFEADDFLNFYKPFIIQNRCKLPPYEYSGSYFAHIDKVLSRADDFIEEIEKFVSRIAIFTTE